MEFLKLEEMKMGKVVQLHEMKFDCKRDCIITYADKNELVLMYYDKEIEELTCKVLTKEDLIFNDYKFELLS